MADSANGLRDARQNRRECNGDIDLMRAIAAMLSQGSSVEEILEGYPAKHDAS